MGDELDAIERAAGLPDPATVRAEPCPEGWRYEWVPEPAFGWLAFRVVRPDEPTRQCRFTVIGRRCPNDAVAKLNRSKSGTPERWWHYCAEHLYGRRIDGQRVWVIHTVREDDA